MSVAAIQRLLLAALFVAASAALCVATWFDRLVLGCVTAFLILTGYSIVLAFEFLCLWFIEPPRNRPSAADLALAWWRETMGTPRVFCWRQPFRRLSVEDYLPDPPRGLRGILLVHGLLCNRAFWHPWMMRLRNLGHPFIALDLEPAFGSISDYADTIDLAVNRLIAATGMAPVVVAHSMGGLVVRYWLQQARLSQPIHRVITIGTPHKGTWLARFAMSPNAREMAIDSEWLRRLASNETAATAAGTTCFYSRCDNVVFPCASAQLEGADNREIECTAHVALAFREEVFAEAIRWLRNSPSCH